MIDEPTTADEPNDEPATDGAADSEAAAAPAKKPAAKKPAAKKPAAKKPAAKKDSAAEPVAAAPTPEERAAAQKAADRSARAAGDVEVRPVRAVAKYLRFSAQKGRLVVDQVRGKTIADAVTLLTFNERAAAREVLKVLKSAVANAENNHGLAADELYVAQAFVDEGPTFKRWKPRARGKADRINKRTCHVTVIVSAAPAELLEGRSGKRRPDRSARVAASKSAGPEKKSSAGRKPAAKKSAARKPASTKKAASDAPAASADGSEK